MERSRPVKGRYLQHAARAKDLEGSQGPNPTVKLTRQTIKTKLFDMSSIANPNPNSDHLVRALSIKLRAATAIAARISEHLLLHQAVMSSVSAASSVCLHHASHMQPQGTTSIHPTPHCVIPVTAIATESWVSRQGQNISLSFGIAD